jgi:hypothetical protein
MELVVKKLYNLCILILVLFPEAPVRARIIHVPADSSTIQAGINGAVDGDTVLVARGHYYERLDFAWTAILVASNFIFDADTTTIDSTIIDGENVGFVVVFPGYGPSASTLQGFTIINGPSKEGARTYVPFDKFDIANNMNDSFVEYEVGGFSSENGPPIMTNNIIAGVEGDAIYCEGYIPQINSNTSSGDFASRAGGIYCWSPAPTIRCNIIANNSGRGIVCETSSPAIYGNIVINNGSSGIYCDVLSSPTISRNSISYNSTGDGDWGGGIWCFMSSPTITGNIIMGNSAYNGGAIYCSHGSQPVIRNNTMIYNTGFFGGVLCLDASPTINSNIIAYSGRGVACLGVSPNPSIAHNVLWKNMFGNFYDCPEGVGDTLWGVNFNNTPCDSFYNIVRDPLFVDTVDFHLLCNSPCIDAGYPNLPISPDSGGCRIDIGVWEYPYVLGDANGDSTAGAADVVFIINYLFRNGIEPCPYHSADGNCDGLVNGADIVCLINYLFRGGDIPC